MGIARSCQIAERGYFIQPASSIQTIEELEAMTSPIKAFIEERCFLKPNAVVPVGNLFSDGGIGAIRMDMGILGSVQSLGKIYARHIHKLEPESYKKMESVRGIMRE